MRGESKHYLHEHETDDAACVAVPKLGVFEVIHDSSPSGSLAVDLLNQALPRAVALVDFVNEFAGVANGVLAAHAPRRNWGSAIEQSARFGGDGIECGGRAYYPSLLRGPATT